MSRVQMIERIKLINHWGRDRVMGEATKKGLNILKPRLENLKFSDCILVQVHSRKKVPLSSRQSGCFII